MYIIYLGKDPVESVGMLSWATVRISRYSLLNTLPPLVFVTSSKASNTTKYRMDPSTHFFLVVFSSSRLTLSSGLPGQLLKKPFDILKHLGRSRSCNASVIPFFDKRPAVSMIRPSVNLFVHAVSKLSSRETCVPRGRKFSDNPSKIPLGYNLVRCCGPSASHRNFPRQL